MLRNENETRLADLMNTSTLTVEESIPAVQLAKIFLMDGARQIIVTRHEKLVGVVNLNGFITKLFWA
jgi:CBS-domain-containing membrane protein